MPVFPSDLEKKRDDAEPKKNNDLRILNLGFLQTVRITFLKNSGR